MTDINLENKYFIDSNVLIYAYDKREQKKYRIASDLISKYISSSDIFYISNQVLSEMFFILTQKIKISVNIARQLINLFIIMENIKILNYTQKTVSDAIEIADRYSIHFWDSLIIATMLENNISSVYTENTKDFSRCDKITAVNVFEETTS